MLNWIGRLTWPGHGGRHSRLIVYLSSANGAADSTIQNLKGSKQEMEIVPFKNKIWLSSPTMHGDELKYVTEAYETNWMSTVGKNIDEIERLIADKVGVKYAVALSAGTAALHLAMKLAGEAVYGQTEIGKGALCGRKVFCSDMTFDATVNPVVYEGGIPVFIDTERDTWNMDPVALEKAFEIYPEVRVIVVAHLYGTPGKIDELRRIADEHGAVIVEDAAESLGATYKGRQPAASAITVASASMETRSSPARPAECSSPIPARMPRRCASGRPRAARRRPGISTRSWATTTA